MQCVRIYALLSYNTGIIHFLLFIPLNIFAEPWYFREKLIQKCFTIHSHWFEMFSKASPIKCFLGIKGFIADSHWTFFPLFFLQGINVKFKIFLWQSCKWKNRIVSCNFTTFLLLCDYFLLLYTEILTVVTPPILDICAHLRWGAHLLVRGKL